ncbi:MAG: hypothetical protein QOJ46_2777 [bacterium]|jgi:GNAT superfamily N-acetyltransferase|nr:hypothetical protein [Frankiaceae bacterium]
MVDTVTVRALDPGELDSYVDPLTDVLVDCVEGGASVGFMLPLARDRARQLWQAVADGVARGERVLLVAELTDGRVVGTVQLVTAMPDNQPHRADLAKMLVHRSARRKGVAQALLAAAEEAARAARRSVLVLDTVTGGDAERLYARLGWQRVGVVPGYALMPTGELCSTTYFYKHL